LDRQGNSVGQSGEGIAALAAVISDLTARLAEAQAEVARLTGEAAEARGQVLQLQAGGGRGSLLEALRKRLGGSSS
jgi:cell division protein FtsB